MKLILTTLATACAMGCTTSQQTQVELENLKTRERILTSTLAVCDAELAKDGKHVVRQGETILWVAKNNGMEVQDLMKLNPDIKYGDIQCWKPGMVIRIKDLKPNQAMQADGAAAPRPDR